jgi:hypothetical protein
MIEVVKDALNHLDQERRLFIIFRGKISHHPIDMYSMIQEGCSMAILKQ